MSLVVPDYFEWWKERWLLSQEFRLTLEPREGLTTLREILSEHLLSAVTNAEGQNLLEIGLSELMPGILPAQD